jgi:hypothetical protein
MVRAFRGPDFFGTGLQGFSWRISLLGVLYFFKTIEIGNIAVQFSHVVLVFSLGKQQHTERVFLPAFFLLSCQRAGLFYIDVLKVAEKPVVTRITPEVWPKC